MIPQRHEIRQAGVENAVLAIENLSITYGKGSEAVHAVRGVTLSIAPGEAYGLIGESGSGKSTVAFSCMGHVAGGEIETGSIKLKGENLLRLSPAGWQSVRGNRVAMVYQDPMNALNPAFKLGAQVAEALIRHRNMTRKDALARAVELFRQVRLPDPENLAQRYPHQISGGQQQRVVIAMAIACEAELLIMDEPTTGLDITTEAHILDLIADLRKRLGMAILFISHNLRVVAQVCDRVGVLYAGQMVEEGPASEVLRRARHPYTMGLNNSLLPIDGAVKRLNPIPGSLPDLRNVPGGCIFAARCAYATPQCKDAVPAIQVVGSRHVSRCIFNEILPLAERAAETRKRFGPEESVPPQLSVVDLDFSYARPSLALPFLNRKEQSKALDRVTLAIRPGETLGIVGESGSGKSTLARCIAGLRAPTGGSVRMEGQRLEPLAGQRSRDARKRVQIVFQNPDSALNPMRTVGEIVSRPIGLYGNASGPEVAKRTAELLEMVNLSERYLTRFPRELSGGEKQRVNIARALAADPDIIICDEPTSALDISVQAAVLNTLIDLRAKRGVAYIFITHDLGVVRYIADRVAVMYSGSVLETGPVREVFANPGHAYTEMLLSAMPRGERHARHAPEEIVSRARPVQGQGCPFADRCLRYLGQECDAVTPPLRLGRNGHMVSCHIPLRT
ncbi:ABC transporter ATP-binding protein [Pseudooceanicola sp. CBS1P-1]|uniref:Dipeptide ABC transporter ATP-binding protein n=1 Tax=Pseudooceanicola albus TaxID=2692189 RepID=A0A6L7GAI8_9RHOB|nr:MULTISPECIES: ABC transporter ATP-binding protein [Pseudooceanicola]MBT9386576.1 ABC transporter ATP-binding protein [Pseudooceanicola endophyticus]MXN20692.1 dipeptide ABC transporter ATP-binding protein [Pseudooceanicola albus]